MSVVFDAMRADVIAWDVNLANSAAAGVMAERQSIRLRALLGAARGSRLLREHLGRRLLRDPLGRHLASDMALGGLPVMHKHDLMGSFDDWVTDPALNLSELRAFTADPGNTAQPFLGRYQVWESSGTSGEPAVFVQDAQAMAVYDALDSLRRAAPHNLRAWLDGQQSGQRVAFVGATTGHFASYVSMQRLRALNPSLAHSLRCFSIDQSPGDLVDALNRFAPSVIAGYPTTAVMLANAAARGALRVDVREVWTAGETMGAAVRRNIEQAFDCQVRNSYGASEFLAMGWECAHGNMHLNADWVILEPVDERYRPVPRGHQSHTTLLTNLANHVQPLIRYDLADQVKVHAAPCACGSPLPVIEVLGRNGDALVLVGHDGQPVTLRPQALTTVLEEEAGVFDFQLQQRDAHTLVLRLGLRGADASAAASRCRLALQAFAARQGLEPLRIVHAPDAVFARGRSGMLQRIVSRADR